MSDSQSNGNGTGPKARRGKRFLSPSEKYELWVSLIRGEYTIAGAAERAGVDPLELALERLRSALVSASCTRVGHGVRARRDGGNGPLELRRLRSASRSG